MCFRLILQLISSLYSIERWMWETPIVVDAISLFSIINRSWNIDGTEARAVTLVLRLRGFCSILLQFPNTSAVYINFISLLLDRREIISLLLILFWKIRDIVRLFTSMLFWLRSKRKWLDKNIIFVKRSSNLLWGVYNVYHY